MNIRKTLIFFSLMICAIQADAQQKFKKLDAFLDANAEVMGGRVILMIYQNGQVVYTHTVNQLSQRQKMINQFVAKRAGTTADQEDYSISKRQPIASCSKWLSAALIMTYVDEGKLKLTDTVGKYLPALSRSGKGKITISDCLAHLTAIKAPGLKENISEVIHSNSMDEAIDYVARLPMEGELGKVFHYSNTGLQIAGAIIEKIDGKSFNTLFLERIAKPLNLKNTDFGINKVALPAGGASSTPEDYLNFLVMILNKGTYNGKRILSEKSIEQMQINRITADVKVGYSPPEAGIWGYGFGEWIGTNNTISSPGLFGSFPMIDNNKKYAAFMMAYYFKSDGRGERYKELKKLMDEALTN